MNDLLTKEEDVVAAAQGWGLYHVYDLNTSAWHVSVLPSQAQQHVVNLAKANHPLPQKALRLINQHRTS
jgi:hypothetical protein